MSPKKANGHPDFGLLFFRIRKHLKLTQVQMCKKLKMSQAHLSKIEANKYEPDARFLLRVLALVGVKWEDFIPAYYLDPEAEIS